MKLGMIPAAKANSVPARLIHVEVYAHALLTQSAGKEQAVFDGHRAVFPSVPDKTGWEFGCTCNSLESIFTSSSAGLLPNRFRFEPWWVNLPIEITG